MLRKMRSRRVVLYPLVVLALSLFIIGNYVDAATTLQPPVKLQWHFYKLKTSCPEAEVYIRYQVELFWKKDKSITPKLLRLLYSDCFVTVCILFNFALLVHSFLIVKASYCYLFVVSIQSIVKDKKKLGAISILPQC